MPSAQFFLGIPVGVERDRTVTTALALTPRISSWLRPRFSTSSSFLLSRTFTSRAPVQENGDSGAFILPQTLNNTRSRDIGVSVDLARLLRQIWGDSGGLGKAVARVRPVDFSTRLARGSTYDLNVFDPDLGFMLGLGGRDDFLSHEGESARGATETRTSTLSSGADLPLGFTATLSYSLTRTDRFQQVADGFTETTSRQREWPVGSLRWTHTFCQGADYPGRGGRGCPPAGRHLDPAGWSSAGPGAPPHPRPSRRTCSSSFRNGLALTASLSTRSQRTENNGNATLLDQDDMTGSLNYSFALPAALSRTRKRVRSNLTAISSKTLTCLEQGVQSRVHCGLRCPTAGDPGRTRYRSAENRERRASVRLFHQRRSPSEPAHLADFPAAVSSSCRSTRGTIGRTGGRHGRRGRDRHYVPDVDATRDRQPRASCAVPLSVRLRLPVLLSVLPAGEDLARLGSSTARPHSATSRARSPLVPEFPGTRGPRRWGTGSTACCASGPTRSWCRVEARHRRRATRFRFEISSPGSIPPRRSGCCCWPTGTAGRWPTAPRSTDSTKPVLGANDGGSGVALLLGVADVLKRAPPAIGVDLLFVDGEDYGDFTKSPNDVLIGSRYYGAHQVAGTKPLYAVLFDLIGDKDLQIYQEGNSLVGAPEVVELVWDTAKDLGYAGYFIASPRHTLIDDHLELQKAGIRAIDVVDFDYPAWHTPYDTIDKVSAASLQVVGDVAVALIRREGTETEEALVIPRAVLPP